MQVATITTKACLKTVSTAERTLEYLRFPGRQPGFESCLADFEPTPLNPEWIIEGRPISRSLPFGESADGDFSFGLWDCTEGQFKYVYRSDELVQILEGEATIRIAENELPLRPGSVAFFPSGTVAYWTVHGYVKKLAIFRSVRRGWFARIMALLKRICCFVGQ